MFFVFKINLHLRVIEHPAQHTIEFERIAGEFEQFRGSVELTPDASGNAGTLNVHTTIVPKGRVPAWVLRGMGRRFLTSVVHALRTRAESY